MVSRSLGGRSWCGISGVNLGFPPGLTPARGAWARPAIGPNRAHDLRDGSTLPGPSPHLSKQAWHSAWFYRPWFYRAARASIREVLQQPVAATVAPVPKCDLNDAVRDRAHLASRMAHGLCGMLA